MPLSLFHWDFSQRNPLYAGPDDGQATHLGGEHVDLVGPLTDEAPQTLDGVSRSNVAMHGLASSRKRSTSALRPQLDFSLLLDRACHIWRVLAASCVTAPSLFG